MKPNEDSGTEDNRTQVVWTSQVEE